MSQCTCTSNYSDFFKTDKSNLNSHVITIKYFKLCSRAQNINNNLYLFIILFLL